MRAIRLTAEAGDGVQVVRVEGELDTLGVDEVRRALGRLAEAGDVVLDLDRVTFIDSAGLHALFALARLPGGGVAVAVAGTSPAAKVIALVRLGDMLPVRESVEEATAALRRSPASAFRPSEGANGGPGGGHGLG
jgi:anti-anti-sigma factor